MSAIERESVAQALELGLLAALGPSDTGRLDRVAYGELVALRFVARHLGIEEIDERITDLLAADRQAELDELEARCSRAA